MIAFSFLGQLVSTQGTDEHPTCDKAITSLSPLR